MEQWERLAVELAWSRFLAAGNRYAEEIFDRLFVQATEGVPLTSRILARSALRQAIIDAGLAVPPAGGDPLFVKIAVAALGPYQLPMDDDE